MLPKHLQGSDITMHDRRLQCLQPVQSIQDTLPESLVALPGPPNTSGEPSTGPRAAVLDCVPSPATYSTPSIHVQYIDSTLNSFGLFRRYHSPTLPTHDPESRTTLAMLSNAPETLSNSQFVNPPDSTTFDISDVGSEFYPYPNKASFLIGEWYWNSGSQKSQNSFKKLLDIIGSDNFSAADIQQTNWSKVNSQLAINDWDVGEWEDEDAGWYRSSVTINVPFYSKKAGPRTKQRIGGPREYVIHDFYHRNLVSVIRERLAKDAQAKRHFHFDPFELLWSRNLPGGQTPLRLQGEAYTSPAFIEAHQKLQASPRELGCNLPRVVVALMFWSDATHLTNFGNTKLWPLYMLFGNDSKYERCKPSSNLCEHLAYFEHVRNHSEC